jgi:hypothetical protein
LGIIKLFHLLFEMLQVHLLCKPMSQWTHRLVVVCGYDCHNTWCHERHARV